MDSIKCGTLSENSVRTGEQDNVYKVNSHWDTSSVIGNRPSVVSKILDVFNVPNSKDKWVYWDITKMRLIAGITEKKITE